MFMSPARLALGLLLPFVLAACATSPTPSAPSAAAPGVYGDGLNHAWTSSAAEGQRLMAALSGGLKSQSIDLGLTLTATSGWGPIELNMSNGETLPGDGRGLSIGGSSYASGLGLHADSEIRLQATGLQTPPCTRFQAEVGVDDEVGNRGSVTFRIYGDGQLLYDSGERTGAMGSRHVDVDLGSRSDLRFVVTPGADNFYDHADWGNPSLGCRTPVQLDSARPVITGVSGDHQLREYTDHGIVLQPTTVTMFGRNLQHASVTFGAFGPGSDVVVSADGTRLSVLAPYVGNQVPMIVATPSGKVNAGIFFDGYGEFRGQAHLLKLSAESGPAAGGTVVQLTTIGNVRAPFDVYFGNARAVQAIEGGWIAPPGSGEVAVRVRCPVADCDPHNGDTIYIPGEALPFYYHP